MLGKCIFFMKMKKEKIMLTASHCWVLQDWPLVTCCVNIFSFHFLLKKMAIEFLISCVRSFSSWCHHEVIKLCLDIKRRNWANTWKKINCFLSNLPSPDLIFLEMLAIRMAAHKSETLRSAIQPTFISKKM